MQKQKDLNATPEPVPAMIPVTAEDFRRAQLKRRAMIAGGALLVVLIAGWIYKRSVDPITARDAVDQGTRQFNNGRYPESILSFSRAISLDSGLADAYQKRGRTYFVTAELDAAVRDYSSAIKLRPSDATLFTGRALARIGLKDFKAAIEDCSRAIELDPKSAVAYNLRGVARRSLGDPRSGLADLQRAVELNPNIDNYYQRGATYQALGEHGKAIADFTEVFEREPDNAHPLFARAQSRLAEGDVKGAREDLELARRLDGR